MMARGKPGHVPVGHGRKRVRTAFLSSASAWTKWTRWTRWAAWALVASLVPACGDDAPAEDLDAAVDEGDAGMPASWRGHGPIAPDIEAPLGHPLPTASREQLEAFDRGRALLERRFTPSDGLGPSFNVTFCGACHEKPTTGGSAGLYRNFVVSGVLTDDGAFLPGESAGMAGGVIRLYHDPEDVPEGVTPDPRRPAIPADTNVFAARNPIPFFGAGLLAELGEDEITKRADPDDEDGDGISGRPNYDRGFVGRFGRKAQTVSLEGFIRGPLFNHMGLTSYPLSEARRALLPVDSSGGGERAEARQLGRLLLKHAQAAAPEAPLTDSDGVPDPEISPRELFDMVSFAMLLAAPVQSELDTRARRGGAVFDRLGCDGCHTPRLMGPRGALPVYSDLLLHDMGDDLADGVVQNDASGREFRTQPLWGLSAVGPYLHDGRAGSVAEAIALHGGEGAAAATAFEQLDNDDRGDLLWFLTQLGGRQQASAGLVAPDAPMPQPGELGGPQTGLDEAQRMRFAVGRATFDREFSFTDGVGAPRFNGDSCRACHFEPAVGGAGPRGVDVMRHGGLRGDTYVAPEVGSILHRATADSRAAVSAGVDTPLFELRQTPHLFGAGLIDDLPRAAIEALADPDDGDGDGISGRAAILPDGRLGRFGWKAQIPSIVEFVRDAAGAELGMTVAERDGASFGITGDDDGAPDPELSEADATRLEDFLRLLGPPPRTAPQDSNRADRGQVLFEETGCALCHVPAIEGPGGPVALYSDLLLHAITEPGRGGIAEGVATREEYRTAPLWGVAATAPFMHDGAAETLEAAIERHAAEGADSRRRFMDLDGDDRSALVAFLETL